MWFSWRHGFRYDWDGVLFSFFLISFLVSLGSVRWPMLLFTPWCTATISLPSSNWSIVDMVECLLRQFSWFNLSSALSLGPMKVSSTFYKEINATISRQLLPLGCGLTIWSFSSFLWTFSSTRALLDRIEDLLLIKRRKLNSLFICHICLFLNLWCLLFSLYSIFNKLLLIWCYSSVSSSSSFLLSMTYFISFTY